MIKATFDIAGVKDYILQQTQRANTAVLNAYKFAGETFVRDARLNGTYTDRTGNLRSSIGYIIIQNGEQIDLNFEEAGNGSEGSIGVTKALEVAEEVAQLYPKGLVLICVAGMEYAYYVEAKDFDVISGSVKPLKEQIQNLLRQL